MPASGMAEAIADAMGELGHERFFDVRSWTEEPACGHFAAWERPSEYAAGVRKAVDLAST